MAPLLHTDHIERTQIIRDLENPSQTVAVDITDQSKTKSTWLGWIWDSADVTSEERKFLFKVDSCILVFASLGYFVSNLDQANVNNAFLSGMKEDLNMYGNQLVRANSIFTIGYCIGQIPMNLILTRVSPRWVIPFCQVGWGVATLAMYSVKTVPAFYALRFLVGLFEAVYFPGIHYILGSWYTHREIAKRSVIFWSSGISATMFSGFLQSAAYTNLDGVHGLAGWRWLFIVDAIITLPIAIGGLIFLPGLPWSTGVSARSFVLTKKDYSLAVARMEAINRKGPESWTWTKAKRIATNWHIWVLPILHTIWGASNIQQPMGYYLKSFNAKPAPVPGRSYTVSQINLLPLPATANLVVMAWIWAWLSDGPLHGRRWPFPIASALLTFIVAVPLRQIPLYSNIKAHFGLYYIATLPVALGPIHLNWISEICGGDNEARALIMALANSWLHVVSAVAPLFVWKTTDFPRARKGFTFVIVAAVLLILWTGLVYFLAEWDKKKAKVASLESDVETPDGTPENESKDDLKKDVEDEGILPLPSLTA